MISGICTSAYGSAWWLVFVWFNNQQRAAAENVALNIIHTLFQEF